MKIGETVEATTWRAHRFNGSIRIQSLIGAGKRGKFCVKFSLSIERERYGQDVGNDVADAIADLARCDVTIEHMRDRLSGICAADPSGYSFWEYELRGVDVPNTEIIINAAKVYVRCDGVDFCVRGKDDVNEPALMPGRRTKGSGKRFYAWLQSYEGDFDTLDFRTLRKLIESAGIDTHFWYALD